MQQPARHMLHKPPAAKQASAALAGLGTAGSSTTGVRQAVADRTAFAAHAVQHPDRHMLQDVSPAKQPSSAQLDLAASSNSSIKMPQTAAAGPEAAPNPAQAVQRQPAKRSRGKRGKRKPSAAGAPLNMAHAPARHGSEGGSFAGAALSAASSPAALDSSTQDAPGAVQPTEPEAISSPASLPSELSSRSAEAGQPPSPSSANSLTRGQASSLQQPRAAAPSPAVAALLGLGLLPPSRQPSQVQQAPSSTRNTWQLERCLPHATPPACLSAGSSAPGDAQPSPQAAPSSLQQTEDASAACVVCWEAPPSILCLPCAHLCLCPACAALVCGRPQSMTAFCVTAADSAALCPVCRGQLAATVAVHG